MNFQVEDRKTWSKPHLFCLHNSQRPLVDCVFQVFCTGFWIFLSVFLHIQITHFWEASPQTKTGRSVEDLTASFYSINGKGKNLRSLVDTASKIHIQVVSWYFHHGSYIAWIEIQCWWNYGTEILCSGWILIWNHMCRNFRVYIYTAYLYIIIYTLYINIYIYHKNSRCLNLFRVNILEPSTKPRICLNFIAKTVMSLPKWVLEVESHHLTSYHCSIPHTNDSANCENTPLQFETVTRSSWSWISTWTFLRKKKHYINHMAAMINFRTKGVCITSLTVHGANSKLWWLWNLELLMIRMLILITISWDTLGMLSWRNGRTPTSGWKCWEITDLEHETTLLTMGVKPPKIWRISITRSHPRIL